MMSNLLDGDREDVAGAVTTILPMLNDTELDETEDYNERHKG